MFRVCLSFDNPRNSTGFRVQLIEPLPITILADSYLAYVYHGIPKPPKELSATQVPHRPPNPGEITLRVCATGLNPMDTKLASTTGIAGWMIDAAVHGATKAKGAGIVFGTDVFGVVIAIGERVAKWKIGDQVFGLHLALDGNGTNQAYLNLSANSPIVPKPTSLSHVEAASLPNVFFTSYTALVTYGGLDRNHDVNAH
ncbi:alcohol dehydrogenase [Ceratobasidium sp. AG-Ba]|nr:alcohol dehydrogenase [Ceratobasidium sp. AG-Ba]